MFFLSRDSTADPAIRRFTRLVIIVLVTLLVCRVVMMVTLPHIDTSESRYAEISRKMVETDEWITPQFDYGIPFWAKPPLSMWMSALGMEIFGVNEFSSRLFIFLAALGVLVVVARATRRESDRLTGLLAATILMGMPLFFYCSAAVMTDLALAVGTTLAMTGFRTAMLEEGSRKHGYVFFIGLAIGLLAKGPLILVLALPPLAAWVLATGQWRRAWTRIPWITGSLLMLAITMPWYIAAERKTPGFLEYFIVGEHWKRFLVRGWQGDMYGNAHSETPGTIWVYLLMVTLPWSIGLSVLRFRGWSGAKQLAMADKGRVLYWLLWAIWPIIFFTPSRNIIATYPLPALPPLAILLAGWVPRPGGERAGAGIHPFHPWLVVPCVALTLTATGLCAFAPNLLPKRTEREIVSAYRKERQREDHLLYFGIRRYSAEFYSEGEAENTRSEKALAERVDAPGRLFVAATERSFAEIPENLRRQFVPVLLRGKKETSLYVERDDTPVLTGIDATKTFPIGN